MPILTGDCSKEILAASWPCVVVEPGGDWLSDAQLHLVGILQQHLDELLATTTQHNGRHAAELPALVMRHMPRIRAAARNLERAGVEAYFCLDSFLDDGLLMQVPVLMLLPQEGEPS